MTIIQHSIKNNILYTVLPLLKNQISFLFSFFGRISRPKSEDFLTIYLHIYFAVKAFKKVCYWLQNAFIFHVAFNGTGPNLLLLPCAFTGVMVQWLERLSHTWKVVGSSPGRVIPKTLNMVFTAFSSGAQYMRMEWGATSGPAPRCSIYCIRRRVA